MASFEGYLLVSDFDGTLLDANRQVSPENIDAIRDFLDKGGRFCGATGRTEVNVRPFIEGLPQSSPWILYNGAAIYDLERNEFLYRAELDHRISAAFLQRVVARVPHINVQIYPGGPFRQVNQHAIPDYEAIDEQQIFENTSLDKVPMSWLKIILCSDDPRDLATAEAMLDDDPLNAHVHRTHSAARYFELTPTGVNKGSALRRLKEILSPAPTCVVAIGDYLNDLEMLIEADISAAPESALPPVKAQAQIVTTSHTDHAIADLLRMLEARSQVG